MEPFKELKILGKGGFGTTYLIQENESKKYYALKKINCTNVSKSQMKSIQQEIEIMQKLDHPNIVKFYGSQIKSDEVEIKMSYADGGDLSTLLKSKVLLEEQIKQIIVQLLLSLNYMHENHVIHRDIKQHNILITEGRYQICDFGVSKTLLHTDAAARTKCGTPYFFAPELAQGKSYNIKADIWSLGVLLFYMLEGQYPYQGKDVQQLVLNQRNEKLPEMKKTSSKELQQICQQMLEKDPKKRIDEKSLLQHMFFDQELKFLLKKYQKAGFEQACQQIHKLLERKSVNEENVEESFVMDPEIEKKKQDLIDFIGLQTFNSIVYKLSLGEFLSEAAKEVDVEKRLTFKSYVEFIIDKRIKK